MCSRGIGSLLGCCFSLIECSCSNLQWYCHLNHRHLPKAIRQVCRQAKLVSQSAIAGRALHCRVVASKGKRLATQN